MGQVILRYEKALTPYFSFRFNTKSFYKVFRSMLEFDLKSKRTSLNFFS